MPEYDKGLTEYVVGGWPRLRIVSERPVKASALELDSAGDVRALYAYAESGACANRQMRGRPYGALWYGNGNLVCLCRTGNEALRAAFEFRRAWAVRKIDDLKKEIADIRAELAEAEKAEKSPMAGRSS